MKLIRALAAGVLLTGLFAAAAPAEAAHRHYRGCGHRAHYSRAYRPYVYGPAYQDPYYYYYRPAPVYVPGYYVAPRVAVAPHRHVYRPYVRPHVSVHFGF